MNVEKKVVIKEEPSAEENTADTKSETILIDVKIEEESDSDSDVESEVDSCADHEIKEEKIVIELEPAAIHQVAYYYNTKCSEDEPLRDKPKLETTDDETDRVKPQKELKGNYSEESSSTFLGNLTRNNGDKPYACSLCHCKFIRKCDLRRHTLVHTGEKPYSCSLCDYKCTQKNNLMRHLRTHTDEKPFSCTLCQYRCAQKCDLTKHMKIHSVEKPYSCPMCEYKCTRKADLTIHLRSHSGEKPYSCSFCDYKCSRKTLLTKHVIRIHTGDSKVLNIVQGLRAVARRNLCP